MLAADAAGAGPKLTFKDVCKPEIGCDPLPPGYTLQDAEAKYEAAEKKGRPKKKFYGTDRSSKAQEKECEEALGMDCVFDANCERTFNPDCQPGWQSFADDEIDEYMFKAGCRPEDGCRPMPTQADMAERAQKYREAAEHGDVQAQFDLGYLYLINQGVRRDPEEAYFWISLAYNANPKVGDGYSSAEREMELLRKQLYFWQISRVESRVKEWKPK